MLRRLENNMTLKRIPALGSLALLPMLFCMCVGLTIISPTQAYAACASPAGVAGSTNYDDTTKTQSVCDGTNWKVIEVVDYSTGTGARVSNQIANDTGSCTTDKTGRLRYNGTSTWEYCNGSAWTAFKRSACVGAASCPNIGDVCTDGTIFVGCPAPNYYRTYTTRCDAGRTYGSSCTGTRVTLQWNNGNSSGFVTVAGITGLNGTTDTATLVATDSDSATAGVQPHKAAAYCDTLSIHGKTDWYLASQPEMVNLYLNRTYINDILPDYYWTTGQVGNNAAWIEDIDGGGSINIGKDNLAYQRCMRHD